MWIAEMRALVLITKGERRMRRHTLRLNILLMVLPIFASLALQVEHAKAVNGWTEYASNPFLTHRSEPITRGYSMTPVSSVDTEIPTIIRCGTERVQL